MELEVSYIRCRDCLVQSIDKLGGVVDIPHIEAIAELITQTMTGPWRYFHTTEHVFEVGGSVDPIEVVAALFHDLIYTQVDQCVSLNICRYIAPFIKEVKGQFFLRDTHELPHSLMFEVVTTVFGMVPGKALPPMAGQNEFLSALVCGLCLEPFLNASQIAQIAACIEATIPFRPLSPLGLTASELLYQRLVTANQQFNFGWSNDQTIEVVKRAVRLGNRDVENFAYPNSADFLDNTWNLMPETNHELTNSNSYTVSGYRWSLQRMEGFMNFLSPQRVFQRFMGEPDEETYQFLISRTQRNLDIAKLYLGCKLVSIAIIEALSNRLGRDNIAVSMMMGEFPTSGIKTPTLEDFLPEVQHPKTAETELEREVLELLCKGRNQDSSYDLKNSPIATFIVQSIGFSEMRPLIQLSKDFFLGTLSASEFLDQCNADVVKAITLGVKQLFESRANCFTSIELSSNGSSYIPGN